MIAGPRQAIVLALMVAVLYARSGLVRRAVDRVVWGRSGASRGPRRWAWLFGSLAIVGIVAWAVTAAVVGHGPPGH